MEETSYILFKYINIKKELEKGFLRQGETGKRWWVYLKHQNLFDNNREKDIDERFNYLIPLLKQMTFLTIFTTRFLIQCGIYSGKILENTFKQRGSSLFFQEFEWIRNIDWRTAAQNYNNSIEKGLLPTRSIIKEHLPLFDAEKVFTPGTWTEDVRKTVNKCFIEITNTVRLFCPKYNTTDNDFPFAPLQNRRVLPDGSIEEDCNNVFVLTMDIIKGTDSEQTNAMKTIIRNTLNEFESKGLYFQDTGDDKYIAWAEDVRVIWDAANVIRIRGEDLKTPSQKFGGTRKGLYFGSFIMLKKSNGEILIHDRMKMNVIPAAFYILPGIDSNIEEQQRNSVIIIPDFIMELCDDKLPIDKENVIKVFVEEKHFPKKSCSIVNMSTIMKNTEGKIRILSSDKKSTRRSLPKTDNLKN